MNFLPDAAYFLGGAFLINALPHLLAGLMGRPFQSPFAKPPGEGLSSSVVNVAWAFANLALAYWLFVRVGAFDLRADDNAASAGLGSLLMALYLSRRFGRFNGGNAPTA